MISWWFPGMTPRMAKRPSGCTVPVNASPKLLPSVNGARTRSDSSGGGLVPPGPSTVSVPSITAPGSSVRRMPSSPDPITSTGRAAKRVGPSSVVCPRARIT